MVFDQESHERDFGNIEDMDREIEEAKLKNTPYIPDRKSKETQKEESYDLIKNSDNVKDEEKIWGLDPDFKASLVTYLEDFNSNLNDYIFDPDVSRKRKILRGAFTLPGMVVVNAAIAALWLPYVATVVPAEYAAFKAKRKDQYQELVSK
ncbi:MAG: hypothetical protein GOV00_00345 [Candidatus Altiarchaeota archaeon]|nr:hypothetical protein [Candidatus Altiarchaeota archaeon]